MLIKTSHCLLLVAVFACGSFLQRKAGNQMQMPACKSLHHRVTRADEDKRRVALPRTSQAPPHCWLSAAKGRWALKHHILSWHLVPEEGSSNFALIPCTLWFFYHSQKDMKSRQRQFLLHKHTYTSIHRNLHSIETYSRSFYDLLGKFPLKQTKDSN